jgi:adenine-specific DNA-methyltransferase
MTPGWRITPIVAELPIGLGWFKRRVVGRSSGETVTGRLRIAGADSATPKRRLSAIKLDNYNRTEVTEIAVATAALEMPSAFRDEAPTDYAARLGSLVSTHQRASVRRELGQFVTPVAVARFMAKLARPGTKHVRVLDPGAGAGVLASALCERLPAGSAGLHVDAYEVDAVMARACRASLAHARSWLASRGVQMTFEVYEIDFVTENAGFLSDTLFDLCPPHLYDIAVLNPPYFKLQKSDPRSRAAADVVHGQPNIYSIFMAICARLLARRGVMVSITPRSFTTGDYFRRFREYLFSQVTPEAVHLFDSRSQAFREDAVLQENVIVRARKARPKAADAVRVSASGGTADLHRKRQQRVPLETIVDFRSSDFVFHIPAHGTDEELLAFVRSWAGSLRSLGLAVSTGPVVAFRARESLVGEPRPGEPCVPLLWLHHVRPLSVEWPIAASRKPQYIRDDRTTQKLLVSSRNYVVLRRFSAKEEARRLVAAPLFGRELSARALGLENHLNYVYRTHGEISRQETLGLAAVLGSSLLDRYFRISNGNTQVNATELRALPLPDVSRIREIGQQLMRASTPVDEFDRVVDDILRVPDGLRVAAEADARG